MNKFTFLPAVLAGASVALVSSALPAAAVTFDFTRVQQFNNTINPASNFKVDVTEVSGKVQFLFTNSGSATVTIADIYFGKSNTFTNYLLNSSVDITNSSGVAFEAGASPNNPGGGIQWNAAFGSDPQNSGYGKGGVDSNVGESVAFSFGYAPGSTFNNVLSGLANGQLTIALHGTSIGGSGGGSDWFSNNSSVTAKDIPEPLTMLGTAAALGFGGLFQRQRNKQQKAQAKA
jgi:hypothetical protein